MLDLGKLTSKMAVHTDTPNQKGIKRQRSSVSADKKKDNKKAYIPSYVQEGEKCVVCGDNSTGTHYRAMTCEGCKGFFRRTIQKSKGAEPDLACKKEGACEISPQTRNACQYCRYKRCLAMKMDPNSVLNEKERKNLKQLIDTNRKERKKRVCQALTTEEWNFLKGIGESYKAIQVSDFYKFMNKKELMEQELPYIPGQMSPSLRHVVEFVRSIPGINKLSPVDICELFFKHLLDIVGLRLAELFDLQENELCFRNFRLRESDLEEYCYMKEIFYFAREYARFVTQDGIILGCLCAIRFLSLDNSKLTNEGKVTETLEAIQHVFLKFLGQERVPSVHTIYSRLVNFENIREYRSKILAKMAMLGPGCQDESEMSLSPQPGGRQTQAPSSSNQQPTATNHLDRPFYQDLIREFNSPEGNREAMLSNSHNLIREINSSDGSRETSHSDSHEVIREINSSEDSRETSHSNVGSSLEDIREPNSSLDNMKRAMLETMPVSDLHYLACDRSSNSSYNSLVVDRENLVTNFKRELLPVQDYAGDGVGRVSIQVDTSDLVLLQNDRGTDMTGGNGDRPDIPVVDYDRTTVSIPDVSYEHPIDRFDDMDRADVTIKHNGEESVASDFSTLPWLDNNGQGNTSRYGYLNGFQTNASRSPELLRCKPSYVPSPYKILPVGRSPNTAKLRVVESCQGFPFPPGVIHPTPLDLTLRDPQTAVQALLLKNAALEATVRRLQYQHSGRDDSSSSQQPDWVPGYYPGHSVTFASGHTQGSAFLSPSPDKHTSEYYHHRQALSPHHSHSHKFNGQTASQYSPAVPSTSRESPHSPVPPSTQRYLSHPLAIPIIQRNVSHSPILPSSRRYSPAAEGTHKNPQTLAGGSPQRYSPSSYSHVDVQRHDPQLLCYSASSFYHNSSIDIRLQDSRCYKRQVDNSEEYHSLPRPTGSKTFCPSYSPDSSTTDSFSPRHLRKLVIKSSPPSSPLRSPQVNVSASHDFHCSSFDHLTPGQSAVIQRDTMSHVEMVDNCDRCTVNSYEHSDELGEDSDRMLDDCDEPIDVCGKQTEDTNQLTEKGDNKTSDATDTQNFPLGDSQNSEKVKRHSSAPSLKKRWRDDYLRKEIKFSN